MREVWNRKSAKSVCTPENTFLLHCRKSHRCLLLIWNLLGSGHPFCKQSYQIMSFSITLKLKEKDSAMVSFFSEGEKRSKNGNDFKNIKQYYISLQALVSVSYKHCLYYQEGQFFINILTFLYFMLTIRRFKLKPITKKSKY